MSSIPNYADAGHRPHAVHTGEAPTTEITRGPYALKVTLNTWGPKDNLFPVIYDALQSNWGDSPSVVSQSNDCDGRTGIGLPSSIDHMTGWCKLSIDQQAYVDSCFAGRTLPQILELLGFNFTIDGVCRAATHQIVRSRIGAGFMQHGGRDNDWRHRGWTMPETIHRACTAFEEAQLSGDSEPPAVILDNLRTCIQTWDPIVAFLDTDEALALDMRESIERYLAAGKHLYSALVDAGIPWQDARRVLPMGMQTYIHSNYSYLSLAGVLARRLEFVMDWEINCVAQLMLREIRMKCHPLISKYLGSASDLARIAKFARLESWPPDGKWPVPPDTQACATCGGPRNMHSDNPGEVDGHPFKPIDGLPRQHRPEQNPFWVLHPDSMNGAEIKWIPTNGAYPHQQLHEELVDEMKA